MTTTYSAFFSSGLLAPQNLSLSVPTYTPYDGYDAPSPATPSSPLPDSDIELDGDREHTPTPESLAHSHSDSRSTSTSNSNSNSNTRPRLRKRRSSLTIGTNPITSIRSPTRNAGAALQLQMHLPTVASPSRSRSGSLSQTLNQNLNENDVYARGVATEATSLVERMRSGSVGGALRPRRGVRRLASVPAPTAPPPTAPLPAIPTLLLSPWCSPHTAGSFPHTAPIGGSFPRTPQMSGFGGGSARPPLAVRPVVQGMGVEGVKGRDRSYSLGNGYRIEEEMKEN